jgi:hypothetical protein
MRKFSLVLSALAVCAAATAANASDPSRACTSAPEAQWLKIADLQAKVEEQGYKVRKAKLKKACGELYAVDKSGERIELFVDPTNAKIVETKKDED